MSNTFFCFLFIVVLFAVASCGGNADTSDGDDDSVTCTGFFSPEINVYVKDSLDESNVIDFATISIRLSDGEDEIYESPEFIGSDDPSSSGSQTAVYYSGLGFNSSNFEISIVVAADGYHTFVTKGVEFQLNTNCGAVNSVAYDVYLCPLESVCL